MGTRVGKGENWQTEPAVSQSSRQEGAPAIRFPVEALHFDLDSDAIDAHCTGPFLVQNQGG
jgi:hypothetical protein